MASRVILKKKKNLLFNHLIGQHTRFILGFSNVVLGQPFESSEFDGFSRFPFSSFATTGYGYPQERNLCTVNNNDLAACSASRLYLHSSFGVPNFGIRTEKIELTSLSRLGWTSCCSRYISTAAANQSRLGGSIGGNDQTDNKQKKEASPEECDEAVEDLSTLKAKTKAKQVQEPHKSAESIVKRLWAKILGIGPTFRAILSMSRDDWAKKLSHYKDEFKSTLQHYWFGTKLLWADVRISSRLLLKLANGKSLSRRERQQLTRTTADIFRLVPFAVFIIVPFMEFLLPVFLKLFPNMLPSTFQDKMKEQEALKRRLNARIEYAKFLQDTVKEMAKEIQNSRSGEMKQTAEDLDEFMNKVRTGARVSNAEILGFAKLFNDEFTLDNISRPRLVNMCKYMGISPYGTDAYLRYMLRKRLQEIKNDDKLIKEEGVESLSEAELRQACRDRGLLGLRSVKEMRQQEEEDKEEEELAKATDSIGGERNMAINKMASTNEQAREEVKSKALEKQEQLCEISRALAVLASASSVSREREEFLRLVRKEMELYNSMVGREGTEGEQEAKKAYKAARKDSDGAMEVAISDKVSSALVDKVDAMLQTLEKEIDEVDAKIGDRWRLLDRDYDGKVSPEEVVSAAMYLKDTLGKEGIYELVSNLSKDSG
ncbi:uncharacterized protein [Cicer arietinum]|uniref:uncharacterized protein isoform X1 n=1 Tax=Cicer arietinum TaxID=3827 RepID=UPI003CC681A2